MECSFHKESFLGPIQRVSPFGDSDVWNEKAALFTFTEDRHAHAARSIFTLVLMFWKDWLSSRVI
jgi:hypothetical protein